MNDPWKFLAFPAAAVAGYVLATTQMAVFVQSSIGVSEYISQILVVAVSGLVAGFLVDEVIPAYIEKKRSGGGMGGGDFGGGGDDGGFGGDSGGGGDIDFGE